MIPVGVVLLSLQTALAPASAAGAQSIAGEYVFQVLSADTPGANTLASGRFVLASEPLDLSPLPVALVQDALRASRWFLRRGDRQPNTCFGFDRSPANVDGHEFYGGIIAAGLSQWRVDGGRTRVHVYQSPDASQFLLGRQTTEGLAGWIEQNDFDGTTRAEWLPFRAQRVGPPTIEACQAALELGARHMRRQQTVDAARFHGSPSRRGRGGDWHVANHFREVS